MTKKDYVAIAGIIREYIYTEINSYTDEGYLAMSPIDVVEDLCLYFKYNNPNFNPDKFKEACGV